MNIEDDVEYVLETEGFHYSNWVFNRKCFCQLLELLEVQFIQEQRQQYEKYEEQIFYGIIMLLCAVSKLD